MERSEHSTYITEFVTKEERCNKVCFRSSNACPHLRRWTLTSCVNWCCNLHNTIPCVPRNSSYWNTPWRGRRSYEHHQAHWSDQGCKAPRVKHTSTKSSQLHPYLQRQPQVHFSCMGRERQSNRKHLHQLIATWIEMGITHPPPIIKSPAE